MRSDYTVYLILCVTIKGVWHIYHMRSNKNISLEFLTTSQMSENFWPPVYLCF